MVGHRLGWKVYDHELLEAIAHRMELPVDDVRGFRRTGPQRGPGLAASAPRGALRSPGSLPRSSGQADRGHRPGGRIDPGRPGAGFMLPRETTLSVRIIAPLPVRALRLAERMGVSVRHGPAGGPRSRSPPFPVRPHDAPDGARPTRTTTTSSLTHTVWDWISPSRSSPGPWKPAGPVPSAQGSVPGARYGSPARSHHGAGISGPEQMPPVPLCRSFHPPRTTTPHTRPSSSRSARVTAHARTPSPPPDLRRTRTTGARDDAPVTARSQDCELCFHTVRTTSTLEDSHAVPSPDPDRFLFLEARFSPDLGRHGGGRRGPPHGHRRAEPRGSGQDHPHCPGRMRRARHRRRHAGPQHRRARPGWSPWPTSSKTGSRAVSTSS